MEMISVKHFAALTGIKECQIRDLTFAKTFPCIRIGARVHIFKDKALKWLEMHEGKTICIKRNAF